MVFMFAALFATAAVAAPADEEEIASLDNLEVKVENQVQEIVIDDSVDELDFELGEEEES